MEVMAVNFASLKDVDDETQFLVSGFMREYQCILFKQHENNPYYNIPKLSIFLTLSYYTLTGYKILEFDSTFAGRGVRLSDDKKTASSHGGNYYVLCGGEPAIKGKAVWRLKVCTTKVALPLAVYS